MILLSYYQRPWKICSSVPTIIISDQVSVRCILSRAGSLPFRLLPVGYWFHNLANAPLNVRYIINSRGTFAHSIFSLFIFLVGILLQQKCLLLSLLRSKEHEYSSVRLKSWKKKYHKKRQLTEANVISHLVPIIVLILKVISSFLCIVRDERE